MRFYAFLCKAAAASRARGRQASTQREPPWRGEVLPCPWGLGVRRRRPALGGSVRGVCGAGVGRRTRRTQLRRRMRWATMRVAAAIGEGAALVTGGAPPRIMYIRPTHSGRGDMQVLCAEAGDCSAAPEVRFVAWRCALSALDVSALGLETRCEVLLKRARSAGRRVGAWPGRERSAPDQARCAVAWLHRSALEVCLNLTSCLSKPTAVRLPTCARRCSRCP